MDSDREPTDPGTPVGGRLPSMVAVALASTTRTPDCGQPYQLVAARSLPPPIVSLPAIVSLPRPSFCGRARSATAPRAVAAPRLSGASEG